MSRYERFEEETIDPLLAVIGVGVVAVICASNIGLAYLLAIYGPKLWVALREMAG